MMKLGCTVVTMVDVPVCRIIITTTTFLLHVFEEDVIDHITLVDEGGLCPEAEVEICFSVKISAAQALFRAFNDPCSDMYLVTPMIFDLQCIPIISLYTKAGSTSPMSFKPIQDVMTHRT